MLICGSLSLNLVCAQHALIHGFKGGHWVWLVVVDEGVGSFFSSSLMMMHSPRLNVDCCGISGVVA